MHEAINSKKNTILKEKIEETIMGYKDAGSPKWFKERNCK